MGYNHLMGSKHLIIVGIDEAGRGPLAGPVSVGAFAFLKPTASRLFKGVKESKQLSEKKREEWFAIIQRSKRSGVIDFCVTMKSNEIIDSKGLSFAIKSALATSLKALNLKPAKCLVLLDGGLKAPVEYLDQKTIIKGDEKKMVIALASICAKVTRDRLMNKLAKRFPEYGFEIHKGYGTKKHYEAIKEYGITEWHRRSFLLCHSREPRRRRSVAEA
ncbi:MAG: ribonuclease HII [Candidatus Taylorbacteria bacterium]|nr:ribonuclease HII [Candidatus Taylorbacteria bacterium]